MTDYNTGYDRGTALARDFIANNSMARVRAAARQARESAQRNRPHTAHDQGLQDGFCCLLANTVWEADHRPPVN